MAYKFQLGAATMSGSLKQEGALECETSLTIGSAALTEAELELLDGITAGTAAASKVMTWAADSSWTAAGGTCANLGTVSAATSITATDLVGTNIDGIIGADTARAGSFTAVVGTTGTYSGVLKTDDTTEASAIGTAAFICDGGASVAKDLYVGDDLLLLSDSAELKFGADSDIAIEHVADTGLAMVGSHANGTNFRINNNAADGDARVEFQLGNTTVWSMGVEDGDSDKFVIEDGAGALGADPAFEIASDKSAKFYGTLEATTSITIGSAAMSEADLEQLDGITAGTAAASKAVVLDGSKNIATIGTIGCGAITSTGESSFGSAVPASADGGALGSASKEWSDLYLADSGVVYLGNDQDVKLIHNADSGVILHTVNAGGTNPAKLALRLSSSSPADNDIIGAIGFDGYCDNGSIGSFASIEGVATDVTNDNKDGALVFGVTIANNIVEIMDIGKTTASTITVADGAYDFNIASHDGTNGLALAGTIVTAAAADMNILLGCAGNGLVVGDLTKLAGVDASAAELNYNNITTLGTSEASKVLTADASGDITIAGAAANMVWDKSEDALEFADNASIEIGTGLDMKMYHDGTNSYITNAQGALKIATETSGIAVTIGHSTSEVTIADNLTVSGNLTVTGTTVTDTVEVISTSSGVLFEGGTDDGHEGTLISAVAGADVTYTLPNLTGHVPLLAGALGNANVTSAEFLLLDGGSSVGTTALAAGDGFLHNDNGTMKHTTIEKIGDFLGGGAGLAVSSGVLSVDIDGLSALGGTGVAQGDHFMFSDGGTEKKITASNLEDWIFGNISGDAAVAAGGALTIANDAVESGMLNDNCISGLTELAAGGVATADELMISDAGTLKRIGVDSFKAYVNSQDVQLVDDSGTFAVGMNYWADLGGAEAATLPASPTVGDIVYVKAASNCSTTNTITINKAGSQTIDGSASIVLESPYAAVSLCYVVADTWRIF